MYSTEEWEPLKGFPLYSISNTGLIQNNRTGRVLKGGYTPDGYLQVTLRHEGRSHQRYVHILVAETFLPRPMDDKYEVNHKSGDKANNNWFNLEWLTHGDNLRHAHATGLRPSAPVKIIETGETFRNATECAEHLGVHKSYVYGHLNGRYPSCKGYHITRI